MRVLLVALVAACWTGEPPAPAPASHASRPRIAAASSDAAIVSAPRPNIATPDAAPGAIIARVGYEAQTGSGDLVLEVFAGSDQGVIRSWNAVALDRNNAPLPNVQVSIIRVAKRITIVRVVNGTIGQIGQVSFSP